LQKTKLFLDLFSQAYDTYKYNIPGVDKTVKCACISELAAIKADPEPTSVSIDNIKNIIKLTPQKQTQ
jgi:hypothetical protein